MGKRTGKKALVVVGVLLFLLGAMAAYAVTKLRGDAEVMADVERHFDQLERAGRLENSADERVEQPGPGQVVPDELPSGEQLTVRPELREPEDAPGRPQKGKRKKLREKKRRSSPRQMEQPASTWPGIEQVAPGTFVLGKSVVEDAQRNHLKYVGRTRASMAGKGGDPIGFKLDRIGRKSALAAIGLSNGDIITAVNGHPLRSVDEALMAAAAVRFSDQFRVDLLRGGQKKSLYFQVR